MMDADLSQLSDGIYFGFPEDEYHLIPRLSASGIKILGASPLQFWLQSWMNPNRQPDKDTPAKKLGRCYHSLILEGDEAFQASYAVAPARADYPDALDSNDELKAACDSLGLKKNGTKAEMTARLRDADPGLQFWSDVVSDFTEANAGREFLSKDQWEEIQQVRFVLNHMPDIKSAFTGGFPEVTILYHEGAIPMKTRMDYLKARGKMAAILDLKSFGNIMSKPIETICEDEIGRNGYFIQPITYNAARSAVRDLWKKHGAAIVHVVDGPEPSAEWLASVLEPAKAQFHFVFARTGGIPDMVACEFSEGETFGKQGFMAHEYWRKGVTLYRNGVNRYRDCMQKYGADVPWIINYGIRKLRDEDFKPWALEYEADLPEEAAA